ncbi:hypothetical protein RchiOBHm_Chr5g0026621 [Rosa chinensis]|uniref:F-box associated interaction domain-containing protein n=1 Tax=Rosa chinensis TaxID=74649 RepID=A0A2P6Q8W6_ROSCH|nr:hypothetical protein RchiOBHm_Chr5g0026621 [Rosa chinensis]
MEKGSRLALYVFKERSRDTSERAIHWLCQDPGGHPVIAALDLAEEKFSILSPPESVRDDREYKTGVLRGYLCLLQRNEGNWPCLFWIMEEYGVKESWKRFLIGTGRRTSLSSRPLCYWKNTKVLLLRNQLEILLGNPKNGSCKGFLDYGCLRLVFDSDLYVESLVSPNFPKKKCSCNHVKPKLQHCTRFSSTASASLLNYCNKIG